MNGGSTIDPPKFWQKYLPNLQKSRVDDEQPKFSVVVNVWFDRRKVSIIVIIHRA
jgi:hypothetical protein